MVALIKRRVNYAAGPELHTVAKARKRVTTLIRHEIASEVQGVSTHKPALPVKGASARGQRKIRYKPLGLRKPWTEEENRLFRLAWHQHEKVTSIAAYLERTPAAIKRQRLALKLPPRREQLRPVNLKVSVDEYLHDAIGKRATELNLTVSGYIRSLLEKDVSSRNGPRWNQVVHSDTSPGGFSSRDCTL